MGFSLGANVLIKALARDLGEFHVEGAVAVSVPIDLRAAQERISRPRNKMYHDYLLRLMRDGLLSGPGVSDEEKELLATKVRGIRDYDHWIIAPRFGFYSAEHYYESSSAKRYLVEVAKPTLIIQADDDPWIPRESFETVAWSKLATWIRLVMTRGGGHVGFHGRGSSVAWHDRAAACFFDGLEK